MMSHWYDSKLDGTAAGDHDLHLCSLGVLEGTTISKVCLPPGYGWFCYLRVFSLCHFLRDRIIWVHKVTLMFASSHICD